MFQNRLLFLLFIILSLFGQNFYAKETVLSEIETVKLINQAKESFEKYNYEMSLKQSRQALANAIYHNNNFQMAVCYNLIGVNFDDLNMLEKAFYFYKKGLFYINKTNHDELKGVINNNLGGIYFYEKKQYAKGIECFKNSLIYKEKTKDLADIYLAKLNIASAYFEINRFNEGMPYFNYVNQYKKYGDESTIVPLNMINGIYYASKNNVKKAISFFEKAIKAGTEQGETFYLSYTHRKYSEFLAKIKIYKKAYESLNLYLQIDRKIISDAMEKKSKISGLNIEIDEYERETKKITTEFKIKHNKLIAEQSKNRKIVIIVLGLLIVTIIFFYFFIQIIRLKAKNKIKDIQSEMQLNMINASIDGQELERKTIAAFLHDNLSSLLSSAGLHLSVFISQNKSQPEEITKTKKILEEAHNQIRNLSHELMPTLLVQFGFLYALEDICEKSSNSQIKFEFNTSIPIKKRYQQDFEMKLYFIINELINNIIKHSQANKAEINIQEIENELSIVIKDNGIGFVNNEFKLSEGFGINQIRARIKNMKGKFSIDSSSNKGAVITLKVPMLKVSAI